MIFLFRMIVTILFSMIFVICRNVIIVIMFFTDLFGKVSLVIVC